MRFSQSSHFEANFPRRSLLGAAAAIVTGGAVLSGSAAASAQESIETRTQRSWETAYDHRAKMENPANPLGCPLGKGI